MGERSVLHLLVWAWAARCATGIRREHAPRARSWLLIEWGVWACLAMDAGALVPRALPAAALLAAEAGLVSSLALLAGFRTLRADLRVGRTTLVPAADWREWVGVALAAAVLASLALAASWPQGAGRAARAVETLDGPVWLATMAVLAVSTRGLALPLGPGQSVSMSGFSAVFTLPLVHAAWPRVADAAGLPEAARWSALMDTAFVLLVTAELYRVALRMAAARALEAERELAGAERRLAGVERLAALANLAAGAAHDFNNVLSVILGEAQLALSGGAASFPRSELEQIQRAAKGAASMTRGLMALARGGAPAGAALTLREALEAPLGLLERDLARRGVRVRRELGPAADARGDFGPLRQVCLNLLLNARDALASRGGGTLWVGALAQDGALVVSVADDGPGLPASVRERLFEPFVSTKGERGTGLGLSSARALVAGLGGTISARDRPGGGALFEVRLPLAPGKALDEPGRL